MRNSRPVIGITMGDVAGVGPEIIAKGLKKQFQEQKASFVIIGDAFYLKQALNITKINIEVRTVHSMEEIEDDATGEIIYCYQVGDMDENIPKGQVNAQAGKYSFYFLEKAVELAMKGDIDAICTAPLNKEALRKGGFNYPGHTEILADLTGTKNYSMMLSAPQLRVIHLTTHMGLIEAVNSITPERTFEVIKLAHDTLAQAGIEQPKIAVCGINPHAGENGLFGNGEEERQQVPGIEQAVAEGINVVGPNPADTLFFRAIRGDFDIIVAAYHDQGHGPVKALGLEAGVNITVGLNYGIVRTSVDHGTAYDIAGKNIADELSLIAALEEAIHLAPKRQDKLK